MENACTKFPKCQKINVSNSNVKLEKVDRKQTPRRHSQNNSIDNLHFETNSMEFQWASNFHIRTFPMSLMWGGN